MNMQVDNTSTSSVTFGQLGPTSSLQLMFAKLQLELAETAKSQAMDKMDAIAEAQDEQKLVSRLLNEARDKKANTTEAAESSTVTYKNVAKRDENGKIMRDGNGEIIREDRTETIEKGKKWSAMSQEMVDYVDEHDLAMDNTLNDHLQREEQWDVLITSLESRLEELGTNTQQEMVYIQDYMGQYNSYLQGANTQISNSNQTLTSLARGQ